MLRTFVATHVAAAAAAAAGSSSTEVAAAATEAGLRPASSAPLILLLRRMQEEGEGELAAPAESGTTVAADSSVSWQKPSTLVIIIGLSVTTALLIGLWLYRVTRRLANHARSIKVLDEIEMEFVNDDLDDVEEDDFHMGCDMHASARMLLPAIPLSLTCSRGATLTHGPFLTWHIRLAHSFPCACRGTSTR